MPTIPEYLEGLEADSTIPSITGTIIKITPPTDEKETQIIKIEDDTKETSISLFIKDKSLWVVNPKLGNQLHAVSSASGKSPSQGLTLKVKSNGTAYITVSKGARLIHSVEQEAEIISEQKLEPKTAADLAIESYVEDRLYIYQIVRQVVEASGISYPLDKLPELTTSVHIELARMGKPPRPSKQQAERKEVHAERNGKKEAPAVKPTPKSDESWRECKHPTTGIKMGDLTAEKIAALLPWAIRVGDHSEKPEVREYARNLHLALEDLNVTPQEALEQYTLKYAQEAYPNSMKSREKAMKDFDAYIVKKKLQDDPIKVMKEFKALWDAATDE